MSASTNPEPSPPVRPSGDRRIVPTGRLWLRRADQAILGGLAFSALVLMTAYWFHHGGHRGELIDIDRAERRSAQFQVDINEAAWPELAQLPGIGEQLARRIVESRAADGPFTAHDDLRRVRGIGPLTLERIRAHLLPMPEEGTVAGNEVDSSPM
jgi:competence protein ComEA